MNQAVFAIESHASETQSLYRDKLAQAFVHSPLSGADLMMNLGMYLRAPILARIITLHHIYERIKNIPGTIMEFGVWFGQNLVLLENLRAIHEPFNKQRKIVGFDTFDGYEGLSVQDKQSIVFDKNSYNTGAEYQSYLNKLLEIHEGSNILGNVRNIHETIKGNVNHTVPHYFKTNPGTLVAFAYFDMGLYEPTKAALTAILPHTVPGSIILFDELTWPESPGEAVAFKEIIRAKNISFKIENCPFFPSKNIVTIL
jgi:hypothetical protein